MLELAFAMAPPSDGADSGSGSLLALLPPMIMMFLIFYFILIRPQQKKQKEARKTDYNKQGRTQVGSRHSLWLVAKRTAHCGYE
ncbi:preprotein translocase subunit YajC [Nitrospina gracilis]|nr:preprotein translocase subunit YajC [Nitrospina gracilis]